MLLSVGYNMEIALFVSSIYFKPIFQNFSSLLFLNILSMFPKFSVYFWLLEQFYFSYYKVLINLNQNINLSFNSNLPRLATQATVRIFITAVGEGPWSVLFVLIILTSPFALLFLAPPERDRGRVTWSQGELNSSLFGADVIWHCMLYDQILSISCMKLFCLFFEMLSLRAAALNLLPVVSNALFK